MADSYIRQSACGTATAILAPSSVDRDTVSSNWSESLSHCDSIVCMLCFYS